jgi:alkylhydroperoxidase family enzyme
VLQDEGDVVEAATVVAGFNFANRVADALDVPLEVPHALSSRRFLRHATMSVMSFCIRLRMNFANRNICSCQPGQVLKELSEATRHAGMGRLPSYFEKLKVRPAILAGQAAICMSLLEEPGIPSDVVRKIGYLVSSLNHDWECAEEFAGLLSRARIAREPIDRYAAGQRRTLATLEDEILGFAHDVTVEATMVTDAQVRSLRVRGLSDRQVLNVVLLVASYNAGNRLSRAFSEPSCHVRRLGHDEAVRLGC